MGISCVGFLATLAVPEAHASIVPLKLDPEARHTVHADPAEGTRRLFVNFGPATLGFADGGLPDDATQNLTRMRALTGHLSGYAGTPAQREAILQAVRADWASYDVVVTDRRPHGMDFIMNQVGPNRPESLSDRVLGIAHLDCDDAAIRNDLSFAFHHADDGHAATSVAMTISQEIAHGFGLEHVDDPADIMFPARGVADPSFIDGCTRVVPADGIGIACTAQHERQCGAPDRQNSHRELLDIVGPANVDTQAPTVVLASGAEALVVAPGETLELPAQAYDDVLIETVRLYLDGEPKAELHEGPFGWTITQMEIGTYEFIAEAVDAAGNRSLSDPLLVYVGVEPPEGVEIGPPELFADLEPTSCRVGRHTSLPWAWTLLTLLGLVARRRRDEGPSLRVVL